MNWQYLDDNDHRELTKKGDMFGESHIEPLSAFSADIDHHFPLEVDHPISALN
jgi:hypothetical protein